MNLLEKKPERNQTREKASKCGKCDRIFSTLVFKIHHWTHRGDKIEPKVTFTERIIIGARRVHKVYYELLHLRFLENTGENTQEG